MRAARSWSTLTPPRRTLLQRHAREDVARHAGVDADADGGLVEQAIDVVDLSFERLQGLEAFAELHVGAGALGPPVVAVDAVAHEEDGEAFGKLAGHGGDAGGGRAR